jgi:hypothetical protein
MFFGPEASYRDGSNRLFMVSFDPSRCMLGQYFKLGHDHFLPHSFQFIVYQSLSSELFTLLLNEP